MTETTKKAVRFSFFTLITVALVAVAVLMIIACVRIYRIGDFPFTRALVAAEFDKIALPVYLCLGLVAAGFVLHPLLPTPSDTDKDRSRMMVHRLRRTTDLALCPAGVAYGIREERDNRLMHRLITLMMLAVVLAVATAYALSFNRFNMDDINGSMIRFMTVLLPCLLLPAGYGVFSLFYNRRSYQRELALYRQAPKEARVAAPAVMGEAPFVRVARYAVLVAAIGLIIGGFMAGGWVDVLTKAINICTECVGLG